MSRRTKATTPAGSKTPATIWANLLHLSYNMWLDRSEEKHEANHTVYKPYLRCESGLWDDVVADMADAGMNMAIIDLGDGVKYESHGEIAVRGAWSPKRLRRELDKMRRLGIEPIPKMNFSTGHDAWLGPYSRCVSSDTYYAVCRELIQEAVALFDRPRFFHLGMDEETFHHQRLFAMAVVRQHELWWHDLHFLIECVEKAGSRAWVWSDPVWRNADAFFRNMPRTVLQSNWYYGRSFRLARKRPALQAYIDLEAHGYDQVPTGSNWSHYENFAGTVKFCRRHVSPQRLLGFMQTSWKPTLEDCRQRHVQAVQAVREARSMT